MRILYVSTILATMDFFKAHISYLQKEGHTVEMACNTKEQKIGRVDDKNCNVHHIDFSRSPMSRQNVEAYKQIKKLIGEGEYDIIHTHTPVASSLVRLACRNHPKVKVLYTAHGFHFYKGAPLKNWLLYYPVEKWLSKYTDVLITINQEDYQRAKKEFQAGQTVYVPGVGLDINKFKDIRIDREAKKRELVLPQDSFTLLSVGELSKRKNHEVVIRAMGRLKNPKLHYLIFGIGPLEEQLRKLAQSLGVADNVHLMGFQANVAQFYKLGDLFVFPSLQEGLPVALMEAMASGLPVIVSRIRGNTDLIDQRMETYLFDPKNLNELTEKLRHVIGQDDLSLIVDSNGKKIGSFGTAPVWEQMKGLYQV